ncbi:MAG: ribosome recycling factor [Candidatus Dojkabacteria bacterium]
MEINKAKAEFDQTVAHLKNDLMQIQTGRATTELLEEIRVEAYGTSSPLQNLANISVTDAKTLVVQAWDKTILETIGKAITAANLGFSVSTEGELVRVRIPDLTEERRRDYVKVMKERVESSRQQVRGVRQKFMQEIEKEQESGGSEDLAKRLKEEVEKLVKTANEQIEELKDKKEKELMTI